jgi:hypothetical protein
MDEEVALLSAMITRREVDEVEGVGIEPHHFVDPQMRAVYESILEHKRTWRVAPSVDAIQRLHPDFRLRVVDDATAYHAPEFINTIKEQDSGVRPGIDLGFSYPDSLIQGVRPTEVVAFLAYTNIGKTQGLMRATHQAYLQNMPPPLFVSLEMEADEIFEKWDAMSAGISSMAMRARHLKPEDYQRWEQAVKRVEGSSSDIVVIDDTRGAATVDRVANLAERYKPGVIAVDYVSLMQAHRDIKSDWERVTHISRGLKQLARALKIPVYVAAQSNRLAESEGPTLDNIAYSISVGQDANIAVGFHQTPEWAKMNKVEVRLLKNRGGPKGFSYERWDRDRMFFEVWRKEHEWLGKKEAESNSGAEEPFAPTAINGRINTAAFGLT